MTAPDPLSHSTFVHADGRLAEVMCQVHLMALTPPRAWELWDIHRTHRPDECLVHLESAYLLLVEEGS
ncbi:hypothetical protein BJY24_004476 [Nocardia transvalensis]|uniref:Uncharacterized protein n=1 Tax=Nocardia transvalensis TaxID=37333 RepID=A0A7W9PG61_9NOCA|nr:hypothetical protein [Nocardia transvalensis]MBB5915564.1 hypothetical protein [Nocardia transvalensis]